MTRINVVPVGELCDQHLLAEHRELTRIPNGIADGKYLDKSKIPDFYTVRTENNPDGGKGHMYFFANKLMYLKKRYLLLCRELRERGFSHKHRWNLATNKNDMPDLFGRYEPTAEAISLNRQRIKERWPKNARYHRIPIDSPEALIVR